MARRILAGLSKLDQDVDRFAIIDGTMVAAYHLGNAALHAHGVTEPSLHFNTPSKFEVPPDSLPTTLKSVYDAFEALEILRSRYVRSSDEPDTNTARSARHQLARMAELCGMNEV
jgi:hypothetical protein